MKKLSAVLVSVMLLSSQIANAQTAQTAEPPAWMKDALTKLEASLTAKYGEGQRARAQRGLRQVSRFWRAEDGDAAAFEEFVNANFAGDRAALDATFARFEHNLEQLYGHMAEIGREFRSQSELDVGPVLPLDDLFAGYDPSAHLSEDLFKSKIAFVVLLNFPLTTLEQRLSEGERWSRREWAEARLAQQFSSRVPAEVYLANARASAEAERYVAGYNVWMHHVVDGEGRRLFPAKMRLLSHWNLRDQIKADYAGGAEGLARQRAVQQVFERIVTQTIPSVVVNNPRYDWNPFTNEVKPTTARDFDDDAPGAEVSAGAKLDAPEPDTRFAKMLLAFESARRVDPYSPTAPTHIARSFNEGREIPEERVREMFERVLTSPLVPRVAALIEKRLGRPLEPFDVWYDGFRARGAYSEAQLDEIVSKKYPTASAFEKDIPNILVKLGFSKERAELIAANVVVDPARGSGHALGAGMRQAKAHLRTRVEKGGMNYKGYNIAVHELGHNVEQTFSLNLIDHTLLQGVPNAAFTEALAFVFQNKDLELLGLSKPDAQSEALKTLNDFWGTFEIAGMSLVDMKTWHWLYEHPRATPSELKAAQLSIARDVWNRYYAPVFKRRDVVLLAVYAHMIDYPLYLPNYPLGHMIAFQIEEQMEKAGKIGPEFERMATAGNIAPDLWMKHATGAPVGPDALLHATERALAALGSDAKD
ncbi:MAG: hypothetical protein JOZ96_23385 [Acidobacteria bacterium]|nr:hypothetical protein [Acidobacteriota bacterium]